MHEQSSFVDLKEHGTILGVHFSPYEWNQDIILIAFKKKIFVGQVLFHDVLELKKLVEFAESDICTAMYLSPETTTTILPINIQFCTAGNQDFALRVFKSDLGEDNTCKILRGHKNYVNDLCYDVENNYIVSTSDDCTAKLWSISSDYECVTTFNLTSPGMSVCWHKEDNSKLLVAEKSGIIRFYNVNTERPILSLDVGKSLSVAHWAPSDSKLVGSLNMGELVLYDVTKPSCPKQTLIYTQNGGSLKFSPMGEVVATVNKLEGLLKVTHIHTMQQRLSAKVTLPTNISWHFRLPIVSLGDDRKLYFFKSQNKKELKAPKEETKERKLETAAPDARFQNPDQTKYCWSMYVDYHRCVQLLGNEHEPCGMFKKVFKSLCPVGWVERWDEQRQEGIFPVTLPDDEFKN